MIWDTISGYESSLGLPAVSSFTPKFAVCLVVLITRKLLEHTSDTHDAQRPKKAARANESSKSSVDETSGICAFRKLYVRNQGKCPTAVAAAEARAPRYRGLGFFSTRTTSFHKFFSPSAPSTCMAVLLVSTVLGMRTSRKLYVRNQGRRPTPAAVTAARTSRYRRLVFFSPKLTYRHQDDPPKSGCSTATRRLEWKRECLRCWRNFQKCENTNIGGCISEPRHGPLHQSKWKALVQSTYATFFPQCLETGSEISTIPILIYSINCVTR